MEYILWMAVVLPVIFCGGVLHYKLKERKNDLWNLIPKCLSTWMMVCTAMIGVVKFHHRENDIWILIAMIFFIVADALLEIQFFVGMGVFAAGHLSLIVWFLQQGYFTLAYLLVWILGMLVMIFVFRKELSKGKEDPRLYLMLLYPAVLMAMMAMAVCLPFTAGPRYWWIGAGSVMFVISDMMVGKNFFGNLPKKAGFWALLLYYIGILGIAMMTWA